MLEAILHHHEQYDGKGYAPGLQGKKTPFLSRILAVVDAFSAMTTDRPYRKALAVEEALMNCAAMQGKRLDPQLAMVFIELITAGKIRQVSLKEQKETTIARHNT